MLKNIHPGEILLEKFLKPQKISGHTLAKAIGVNKSHIYQIIRGQCHITAKMALKLSSYFGNSWQFWMGLQNGYEIKQELMKQNMDLKAFYEAIKESKHKDLKTYNSIEEFEKSFMGKQASDWSLCWDQTNSDGYLVGENDNAWGRNLCGL